MQDIRNHRGAPLYSGTPAPSSGLVKANFFVYYDFYNRLMPYISKEGEYVSANTGKAAKMAGEASAH